MRSYAMKLTVAGMAAAVSLTLTSCGPDNSDVSGDAAAGAAGTTAATAGAAGGAATGGAAAGGATAAPTGAAAGGAAVGGAATGGATAAPTGAAAGGAGAGGAAAGGSGGGKAPTAATAVKVGQPATVDFADKQAKVATKLQVTVTGYETGSVDDLKAAGDTTAGLEGRTLIYVSYTMKNIGDASLSFTAPDSKFAVYDQNGQKGWPAGNAAKPVPKCTGAKFHGFAKGNEVKGCAIVSLTGNTVSSVGYSDLNDLLKLQASWSK